MPKDQPKTERFTSNAQWPRPEVKLGTYNNVSTDFHDSKEDAEAICQLLMKNGFGGRGVIFPIKVWVGTQSEPTGLS